MSHVRAKAGWLVAILWGVTTTSRPVMGQGNFAVARGPLAGNEALSSSTMVYMGRFQQQQAKGGFGLNAWGTFGARQFDASDMMKSIRQMLGTHPAGAYLRASARKQQPAALGLVNRSERQDIALYAGRYPLCDYYLATVKTHRLADAAILGNLPPSDVLLATDYALPNQNEAYRLAVNAIKDFSSNGRQRLVAKRLCVKVVDHVGRLVWRMRIQDGTLIYTADAGDELYSLRSHFFHSDGKATIFPVNAKDPELQKFTLTGLRENGKLANDYFYQTVASESQIPLVSKDDNDFTFAIDTPDFRQTSIFTNANRVLDWFNNQGYRSFGSQRVRLVAHAVIRNDVNNAIYKPAGNGEPPTIYVGDGDGVTLRNLAVDSDVVGHEFGHHIIFRTIQETEGEAAVLHEGLADFFTFARTGDSCLGESICPVGSRACMIENRCLRTATNDYNLNSSSLPTDPHLRGQLVSGTLWDMIQQDGIPSDDMVKLTLHALDFQVANSGYGQLFLGLMHADKEIFDGKYCSKIYARAQARGFGTRLNGFSCDNVLPNVQSLAADAPVGDEVAAAQKKKSGACTVLATGADAANPFLFLISACLPFVLAWLRKKSSF